MFELGTVYSKTIIFLIENTNPFTVIPIQGVSKLLMKTKALHGILLLDG